MTKQSVKLTPTPASTAPARTPHQRRVRPELRWNAFLIFAGLVLLVYPAIVFLKHERGKDLNTQEILVGALAANIITMLTGFIGQNLSMKHTRHAMRDEGEATRINAEVAAEASVSAAEKAVELKQVVDNIEKVTSGMEKATNGNLHRAVQEVGEQVRKSDGMVPISEVELMLKKHLKHVDEKMDVIRKEGCGEIAEQAAVRAIMLFTNAQDTKGS